MRKSHYDYNKRWRYKNPDKRYEQKNRYYNKTLKALNRCSIWSVEEIKLVMDHKIPDSELAQKIGRSVRAIQIIRCKTKQKLKGDI